MIPRIGQEVVVEFLEGDPDRPLVTGAVYNADNIPPYALPGDKTMGGVSPTRPRAAAATTSSFSRTRRAARSSACMARKTIRW